MLASWCFVEKLFDPNGQADWIQENITVRTRKSHGKITAPGLLRGPSEHIA